MSRNSSQKCAQKIPTVSTRAENICHCQRPSRARTLNNHKKVPMMIIRLANFSTFSVLFSGGLTQFPGRSGLKPLLPCGNGRNSVILRKSYSVIDGSQNRDFYDFKIRLMKNLIIPSDVNPLVSVLAPTVLLLLSMYPCLRFYRVHGTLPEYPH